MCFYNVLASPRDRLWEPIWDRFWIDLGSDFGSILEPFWSHFGRFLALEMRPIFYAYLKPHFEPILELFWPDFGMFFGSKSYFFFIRFKKHWLNRKVRKSLKTHGFLTIFMVSHTLVCIKVICDIDVFTISISMFLFECYKFAFFWFLRPILEVKMAPKSIIFRVKIVYKILSQIGTQK